MEIFDKIKSDYKYQFILYATSSLFLYKLYSIYKENRNLNQRRKRLMENASETLLRRNEKIKEFVETYKNEISKEDIENVLKLSNLELALAIKNQKITSRKATLVYCLNSAIVGLELNGIADIDFEKALLEAEAADIKIKNSAKEDLPNLIGLPITIKDHVPVYGYIDTLGYCSKVYNISKKDCDVVKSLKELGVVIIAKSNVIQALMGAESTNRIYGTCKNIYNLQRTTGGSSGGEACLISSYCSPLGIGTDIGGSIRNPASFCGIYGFKPTVNKISSIGVKNLDNSENSAFPFWKCSTGYLSKDFDGILLLSQNLFGSFDHYEADHRKFNYEEFNSERKIKVGYSFSHKGFEVHSSVKNSITETIKLLKENKYNYEFIEFDIDIFSDLLKKGVNLLLNGSTLLTVKDGLAGEELIESYKDLTTLIEAPKFMINIMKNILSIFTNEKRKVQFINDYERYENLDDLWKNGQLFYKMRDEFYEYCKVKEIEAFILPTYPVPAPLIGNSLITNNTFFYLMFMNILNLPSISIPTALNDDIEYKTQFNDQLAKLMKDDVKTSKGMPVAIQIAALPGKDEIALRLARDCSDSLKFKYNDISVKCDKNDKFWELRKVKN